MSLRPVAHYLKSSLGTTTTSDLSDVRLTVRSVETINLGTGTLTQTIATVASNEVRPLVDVTVSVTNGQFLSDATLTIASAYHRHADLITVDYTPSDIPAGRSIFIVDDRNGNTLATLTNVSSGLLRLSLDAAQNAWIVTETIDTTDANPTFAVVTVTGSIKNANGTTSLPSYTFSGDPDTGIISDSANALGFVTGGTERWVINSSGALNPIVDNTYDIGNGTVNPRDVNISRNLVLGTTTPGTITGSAGAITIAAAGTNKSTTIAASGTGAVAISAAGSSGALTFAAGAGDKTSGLGFAADSWFFRKTSGQGTWQTANGAASFWEVQATTSGADATFLATSTSGGTAYIGTVGTTNNIITGSAVGTLAIRAHGSIMLGPNDGALALTLNTDLSSVFTGAVTTVGRIKAIAVKTTTYTVATTDHVIVGNHATVAFTITLIAASGNAGREFVIKNKGAAVVTVAATGLGQIDGANTVTLNQYQSTHIVSDGTTWNAI